MKNIEKYPNTKDALEAYQAREMGAFTTFTFREWCDREYEAPKLLTLLEAAKAVDNCIRATPLAVRWSRPYGMLTDAIKFEETRPKRNYERFGTAEEAMRYFVKHCRNKDYCQFCPLRSVHDIDSVGWISCFARWLDSTEEFLANERSIRNEEDK